MNLKYIGITCCIGLLLVCAFIGVASAKTLYVCSVGCNFTNIEDAINNASAGDTIFVYNGTYFELILIGEYRDTTTIDGYLSGDVKSLEERNYTRDEVVSVGSNSFDMSWVTSTELRCFFDYGLSSSDLNNTLSAPDLSTKYHWVEIKGLNEETTYYYRINCSFNEINNFTTLPLEVGNYLFSFAVATDTHWSSSNSIGDVGHMYKYSDRLLADVVSAINAEDINFTILPGDLTDNGRSYEFDNVSERLNDLDKPFYPVIGNHDKFEGSWVTKWAELGQENTTYSFNFSGWHFIVLDSVNDTNPNQGILTKDIMEWLQDDLKAHKAMPTIICLHFLVNEVPELSELPTIPGWSPYIDNRKDFKDLLNNYPNVVAVLSGHGHFNSITYNNSVVFIETASMIQYPITYDIYHVYEYGFIKTQHKLYHDLNISELSRKTAVTYLNGIHPRLGDYYVSFIFGTLSDRSALAPSPEMDFEAINVSFAPKNPREREIVNVRLFINYTGPPGICLVPVDFTAYKNGNDTVIGRNYTTMIPGISKVSINWDTKGFEGNYTIEAMVDPSNDFSETNETNNVATGNITIQPSKVIFDTGPGTYPSIFGMHTGTITPNQPITVSKLYTYPCVGTGGHTEYAKICNDSWSIETLPWKGYKGDWHNLSFPESFKLYANVEYNYTIKAGSYPQIHHNTSLLTTNGWINCTEFVDANGKIYKDWIPAIKLE